MKGQRSDLSPRICERCKSNYEPKQDSQIYCSPGCGSKARTDAMKLRFKQELTQAEIISKAMSALAKRGAEKRKMIKTLEEAWADMTDQEVLDYLKSRTIPMRDNGNFRYVGDDCPIYEAALILQARGLGNLHRQFGSRNNRKWFRLNEDLEDEKRRKLKEENLSKDENQSI